MLSEETRRKLREMNFGELVEALDLQEKQPEYMALTFDERMNLAVDYTYSAKYNSKVHRLINAAKFRIADAALANVYYEKRGLDKDLILTLGNCGFIEKNQPVVFNGFTGSGKSYLACAIGRQARKTKCSITVSRLTYEDYLKFRNLQFDRQNQIAHKERSEYKKKRERLLQLYEKARHNTGWKNPDGIASSDGHAKKSMQAIVSKGKRFEREKDNFTEIPDRETGIITKFDSNIFVPSQKRIIDIELPELKIDGKVLSTNIVLSVIGNQHVCIIGKNGAGKSTLLKTIWHELKGRTDIVVGYMPQDYRDVLDYDSTPVDYLQTTYDKETYTKALTFMGTMKFTRDEMHHKIGELSGGQRAKIIYLGMVLQNANVLVLDEPTRNFSPLSAPVIRTALSEFNGTIISISHDRMYLDEVADVIYELSDNGLNTVL